MSSYSHKSVIAAVVILLRSMIISIFITWKHFKLMSTKCRYTWAINKKSSRFSYKKKKAAVEYCSICLSEFEDGQKGRELVDCKHSFHMHCLEKWLLTGHCHKATCPLCRILVLPETIVAECQRLQIGSSCVSC